MNYLFAIPESQYLTGFSSIQCQHGSDFIPRQAIASNSAAYKSTISLFNLLNDGDASNLITRANYICSDANSTSAATPLFYVGIPLASGNFNTGISLQNSPLYLRTINTSVSNLYCEAWLYYSTVIMLQPDSQHIVSV